MTNNCIQFSQFHNKEYIHILFYVIVNWGTRITLLFSSWLLIWVELWQMNKEESNGQKKEPARHKIPPTNITGIGYWQSLHWQFSHLITFGFGCIIIGISWINLYMLLMRLVVTFEWICSLITRLHVQIGLLDIGC